MVVVVLCLHVLLQGAMSGQTLHRSVLAPSQTAKSGGISASWTAGQSSTLSYTAGTMRLTTGFQQAYRRSGTRGIVRVMNCSGEPGDTVAGVIRLESSSFVPGSLPSALRLTLSFNKTLLAPIAVNDGDIAIVSDDLGPERRTISFVVPVAPASGDQDLATVDYIVGLGNDSLTSLRLETVEPLGTNVLLASRDGVFTLLGICYEGGPRLIEPEAQVTALAIIPNPAQDNTSVAFDVTESVTASITVFDLTGLRIADIVRESVFDAGRQRVGFDVSMFPAGTYIVMITAGGRRSTIPMTVTR